MNVLKKSFLVTAIVSMLVSVSIANFRVAHASTEVSGILERNATWKKANSPYNLTGHILVSKGVALTIEPGVTVNLNNYYIQVEGILSARGNSTDKIYFDAGSEPPLWSIRFMSSSMDWKEHPGSGCIIENAVVYGCGISINQSFPKIRNNSIIAENAIDVYGTGSVYTKCSPVISGNIINGDVGVHWASPTLINNNITGGIFGVSRQGYMSISDNTIRGGGHGNGIGIDVCQVHIYNNVISNCSIGIKTGDIIENNTIVNNVFGITDLQRNCSIRYNNFGNNSKYNIYVNSSANVNATFNWWGTTDTQAINQSIYDFKNDFNFGTVNFVPFLTEPNPAAPKIPEPPKVSEQQQPDYPIELIAIALVAIAVATVIGLRIYRTKKQPLT